MLKFKQVKLITVQKGDKNSFDLKKKPKQKTS
jgi:hypothetical protein